MAVLAPLALAVGPTVASWGLESAATAGLFGAGSAAYGAFEAADTISSAVSTFGTIGQIASGVGTAMSAIGARNAGIAANQESTYRAEQANIDAGQQRASAQRSQIEQIRQMRLVESRGQAIAAASGAGALDPSVMDIMGDLETQGRYKAAVAGYQGEDAARNLETTAGLDRYTGQNAQRAGNVKYLSTIMSGSTDMYTKYDGGSYG